MPLARRTPERGQLLDDAGDHGRGWARLFIGEVELQPFVVGSTLAGDPAQVEAGPITRVYRLDLSQSPAEPALLDSLELPGTLYRVRSEAGRLVVLQAIFPAQPCQPQRTFSSSEGGSWPERLRVMDLRAEPTGYRVQAELEVEGEGFVETAQAFVLTHGGFYSDPAELTVVEISAEGLSAWPSVKVEGPVATRAPMRSASHASSGWRRSVPSFAGRRPTPFGTASTNFERGGAT